LIVVFTPHFVIKPMQMHCAPLQIAATIVFIPDDKRLSGDDTIVNPHFFFFKQPKGTQQIPVG
jgi:hypothetical protein